MNFQVTIVVLLLAVSAYGATVPTTPKAVVQTQDEVDTHELEDTVSKVISLVGRQLTVIAGTKSDDVTKEEKGELKKELKNINTELQAVVKGHEEDLGVTLETVSSILDDSEGSSDDESEYGKWKKIKKKLTSKKAKKIYKTAGKIALRVAIGSLVG